MEQAWFVFTLQKAAPKIPSDISFFFREIAMNNLFNLLSLNDDEETTEDESEEENQVEKELEEKVKEITSEIMEDDIAMEGFEVVSKRKVRPKKSLETITFKQLSPWAFLLEDVFILFNQWLEGYHAPTLRRGKEVLITQNSLQTLAFYR